MKRYKLVIVLGIIIACIIFFISKDKARDFFICTSFAGFILLLNDFRKNKDFGYLVILSYFIVTLITSFIAIRLVMLFAIASCITYAYFIVTTYNEYSEGKELEKDIKREEIERYLSKRNFILGIKQDTILLR